MCKFAATHPQPLFLEGSLKSRCQRQPGLMYRNFNLVGAIHELPLHANKNSSRRPSLMFRNFKILFIPLIGEARWVM